MSDEKDLEEIVTARVKRRACKFNLPGDDKTYCFGDEVKVTRKVLLDHPQSLASVEEWEKIKPAEPEPTPAQAPEPEVESSPDIDSEDAFAALLEEE